MTDFDPNWPHGHVTRDGRKARVICTDAAGSDPVVALILDYAGNEITGTYHHVSQQHLKRYLAEFDFRYNERIALEVSDTQRTTKALKGIVGKRLTYRVTSEA